MKLFGNSKKRPDLHNTSSFEAISDEKAEEAIKAAFEAKNEKKASETAPKKEVASKKDPTPKGPTPKKDHKRTLIIVGIIVAVLIAAVAGVGVYVSGIDTIYPGVSLDGVELGKLSLMEAVQKLQDAGWDNTDNAEVTFLLPLDYKVTVSAEESGTQFSSADGAMMAYDYCHDGNIFSNLTRYIKCAVSGVELEMDVEADKDIIRERVDDSVTRVTEELMTSGVEVGEESITIVKGAKAVNIDSEKLINEIATALEARDYGEHEFEIDVEEAAELDIDELYDSVHCEVEDAYYDKETGEVVEEVVGIDFDKAEAEALWNAAEYGETIEIEIVRTEPELTAADIEAMFYADVLGTNHTSLSGSSQNRITNVKLACAAIDGLELKPGESFSYNDVVGERTEAKGYKPAGAYSGGQVVQEVGGGICQVSSTLYYSALLSNLQITNRLCHYFPVGYMSPGLDATVSWGGPEFKFKNNRDWPIKITATVDDKTNSMTITIHGTDVDGSYVEMSYATWAVYNNSQYPEVSTGYKAATYRWVYDKDGNLLSKEIEAYSEYHYHEENIVLPTPEPTPTPLPTLPPEIVDPPPIDPDPGESDIPVPTDPNPPVEA